MERWLVLCCVVSIVKGRVKRRVQRERTKVEGRGSDTPRRCGGATEGMEWMDRPHHGTDWEPTTSSTSENTSDSSLLQLARDINEDLDHALHSKETKAGRNERDRSRARSTRPSETSESPWKDILPKDTWESSPSGTGKTEAWTPRPRPGRTREACLQKKVEDLTEKLRQAKHKKQMAEEELAEQRRERQNVERRLKIQYEDRLRDCRREIHKTKQQLAEANEKAEIMATQERPEANGTAETEVDHLRCRIQQQEKVILQYKQNEDQADKNAKAMEKTLSEERQTSSKIVQELERENKELRNNVRSLQEKMKPESPSVPPSAKTQPISLDASQDQHLPDPALEALEARDKTTPRLERPPRQPDCLQSFIVRSIGGPAEKTSLLHAGSLPSEVDELTLLCNEQWALLEQLFQQLSRSQVSTPMHDSHLYYHLITQLDKIDHAQSLGRPRLGFVGFQQAPTCQPHQGISRHDGLTKDDADLKDSLLAANKRVSELEAALCDSKQTLATLGRADPSSPLRQKVLELEFRLQTQEEAWREALATVRKSAASEVRTIRAHAAAALRLRDQRLATLRGELQELLSIAHACLQPREL